MINKLTDIDQWHLERRGKFTSSENYKLLGMGKRGEFFTQTALSYIEKKAVEITTNIWERPELEEAKSILHGRVFEFNAFEWYIRETKNYSLTYLGEANPLFIDYEPLKGDSGGSPDAINITDSNSVDVGLEIKCPKDPIIHFRRLQWKDQWDIKENYPLLYTQAQHLLMCTGASEWHTISFDDRQKNYKNKGKIIVVYSDKKFQDELDIRLRMAIKERNKMIEGW